MQPAQFKLLSVSRFILGSNPFSGFSHHSEEKDWEMRRYFSTNRIKQILFEAQDLGVNTFIARTDFHVMRVFFEFQEDGGSIQWFAQTCPEVGSHQNCIQRASDYGAKACHIHGGVMDNLYAQGKLDEIPPALDMIREKGMLAGIAAHKPEVISWAEENLDVDYYLCSYYNPIPRDMNPEHVSGTDEIYLEQDRQTMTNLIPSLSKPAIHYKIMAAGRNDPHKAFAYAASKMRSNDAVCVGIYPKDNPNMLRENIELLSKYLS
ncbi:MAG: hypothetical protein JEZ06_04780 [Anaerolineaceae bacterium]|nr:hypothetical protein [Anaerolineaceae bacterium]